MTGPTPSWRHTQRMSPECFSYFSALGGQHFTGGRILAGKISNNYINNKHQRFGLVIKTFFRVIMSMNICIVGLNMYAISVLIGQFCCSRF